MEHRALVEAKHIGIVACTADGATLCYRTVCREAESLMGPRAHPEITMHTFSLRAYLDAIDRSDWDEVAALMSRSAGKLTAAGADLIICPNNTLHQAFERVATSVPWLHIADVVVAEAARRRFRRAGILGTRVVMEGAMYSRVLERAGVECLLPETHERAWIDRIIRTDLIAGRFSEDLRAFLRGVIDHLRTRGCEAVILACTELPLLVSEEHSALPLLDSTRLLAQAALRQAIPVRRNLGGTEQAATLTHNIAPVN